MQEQGTPRHFVPPTHNGPCMPLPAPCPYLPVPLVLVLCSHSGVMMAWTWRSERHVPNPSSCCTVSCNIDSTSTAVAARRLLNKGGFSCVAVVEARHHAYLLGSEVVVNKLRGPHHHRHRRREVTQLMVLSPCAPRVLCTRRLPPLSPTHCMHPGRMVGVTAWTCAICMAATHAHRLPRPRRLGRQGAQTCSHRRCQPPRRRHSPC